jgi:hypothetical protein
MEKITKNYFQKEKKMYKKWKKWAMVNQINKTSHLESFNKKPSS